MTPRSRAELLEENAALLRRVEELERLHASLCDGTVSRPAADTAQLERLLETALVGIFQTDERGHCTFASDRWCRMTGFTIERTLGLGWLEAVHPEDRERLGMGWAEATRARRDHSDEFRIHTTDDTIIWVSARAVALHAPTGELIGYAGAIMDVTERHRTLEELAGQRAFLRQVIDLDPGFIFAKDREGRFTLVNQAVADAYGTTVEDLIGKTDADFNPNVDEVEHFRRDDLEVMDTRRDKVISEEVITDARGRIRYLQTIKRAIVSPDGSSNQVLGVSTDITARKLLEEERPQAQKMEAIGRLAGGVSHDFNNLLTVILGSADLMLRELQSGTPLHVNAQEVRKAAERAALLTQRLLAFSRMQVLMPQVLDLSRTVRDNADLLRRLIGEDVELVTALSPNPVLVRADPSQMMQVILNLAINARDAMSGGGRLTIETTAVRVEPDGIAGAGDATPGAYSLLAVSDTGPGIDPDIRSHIFEPFFTTKAPGQGTGLGLSISYGIVRQSGGFISLSSDEGKGTTFRVFLPRVEEEEDVVPEPAAQLPGGAGETILLVEDDASVRSVAAEVLRKNGYLVIEASNGVEALELARSLKKEVHLLVTDIVMPVLGGLELATRLRETRPKTRVIYTSGYVNDAVDLRAAQQAGETFLPKPYVPAALERRVREVLSSARS